MKKNISINISGIIFHIEEDAFERLRNYLDSINSYFSSFDDSNEIIADIEGRIAEIFLSKLNENKQVINEADVEELITTMGSIRDFQAVEDPLEEEDSKKQSTEEDTHWKDTSSRKLYRDEKRKLLGGVCAGIAHYFKIDPIWVRLLFVIITLGGYGVPIVIYAILWAVIPANFELSEDRKTKKLFRNPEGKVLGGVAKGVASYFGIDVAVVRLLFILTSIIGGTGLVVYIVLWIVLPEARSITDKVQMEGDPVTLSNIESNIKRSLNVKEGEENIFVKILLFPFRLIATIIKGLGRVLGPVLLFLVEFIRVVIGIAFVIAGLGIIFSLVVCLGVFLGLLSTQAWETSTLGFPFELMADTFPAFTTLAAFFAIFVPCVIVILLGISLVAKRIIFNATVGWSLFALFIISVIMLSATVPGIVYKFREDGEHRVTQTYDLGNRTAMLTMREVGMEDYKVTKLRLRGHDGLDYRLEQIFEAQGSSRLNAIENAQMVNYNVDFEADSILVFDSNIRFKEDAIFRAQRLEMTLYIPYNKPFMMSDNLQFIIYNTIHRAGYRVWDMPDNTWMMTPQGLECMTCESDRDNYEQSLGDYDQEFNFRNFRDIDITSAFVVNITQADEYRVLVKGKKRSIDEVNIKQNGDKLYIDYDSRDIVRRLKDREDVEIKITMPSINDIDITGATKLYLSGFDEEFASINLSGASFVKAAISVDELDIDLTGASELHLDGAGNDLKADINGASHLDAYDFEVKRATIEANAASTAKVNVSQELDIEETFASSVKYKGEAIVRRERNSTGN
ncbi:PspC domain-containing protein [Fulvivirga sp. RKSG066]|uniref:PspC domain-containing protein n=1 Tax=Fulvivirga aurantia TaxID=2529383 RepID=UPI0012BC8364|nr:PspC domain-containing protein [Fulvivirga aurantia]MTI23206.1 PspC domain-containing protein [Fulvivirga aurantia]